MEGRLILPILLSMRHASVLQRSEFLRLLLRLLGTHEILQGSFDTWRSLSSVRLISASKFVDAVFYLLALDGVDALGFGGDLRFGCGLITIGRCGENRLEECLIAA